MGGGFYHNEYSGITRKQVRSARQGKLDRQSALLLLKGLVRDY